MRLPATMPSSMSHDPHFHKCFHLIAGIVPAVRSLRRRTSRSYFLAIAGHESGRRFSRESNFKLAIIHRKNKTPANYCPGCRPALDSKQKSSIEWVNRPSLSITIQVDARFSANPAFVEGFSVAFNPRSSSVQVTTGWRAGRQQRRWFRVEVRKSPQT